MVVAPSPRAFKIVFLLAQGSLRCCPPPLPKVSFETRSEINELLGGLEKLLSGIMFLGEMSPRSKDLLVSYGERMCVPAPSALKCTSFDFIGLQRQP